MTQENANPAGLSRPAGAEIGSLGSKLDLPNTTIGHCNQDATDTGATKPVLEKDGRIFVSGLNFSIAIGADPFRDLGYPAALTPSIPWFSAPRMPPRGASGPVSGKALSATPIGEASAADSCLSIYKAARQ